MVYGGVLQLAFKGIQKTIGNLALRRLGASKVTLEMVDVSQLEPGVRQEGYRGKTLKHLTKLLDWLVTA